MLALRACSGCRSLYVIQCRGSFPWMAYSVGAGRTVFAPFPESSQYFGDPAQVWMLNFRVRDMGKMAAQLQAAGIAIQVDSQTYPNGRFARLHDPEGNPIELWEPKMATAAG